MRDLTMDNRSAIDSGVLPGAEIYLSNRQDHNLQNCVTGTQLGRPSFHSGSVSQVVADCTTRYLYRSYNYIPRRRQAGVGSNCY